MIYKSHVVIYNKTLVERSLGLQKQGFDPGGRGWGYSHSVLYHSVLYGYVPINGVPFLRFYFGSGYRFAAATGIEKGIAIWEKFKF